MPLYETVMQEKPPVVLDIGYAYTKLGFAAEAHPRKIIPSQVILSLKGIKKLLFDYNDDKELYDQLIEFFQVIFFKHLLVSPKERKLVIVENIFGKALIRDTIARIMFVHFEVSSILFVSTHVTALSVLAVPTAVVVDMGYTETTVMPIYHGAQIMQGFQDQKYGGQTVHEEIKRQLLEFGVNETCLKENILEDIKIRTCFVTNLERAQNYRNGTSPAEPPAIDYVIDGEHIIQIPGKTRETAFEIMFEDSVENDSLPHLIIKAILHTSVDVRKSLMKNIFLIGGSAMIIGILPRLKEELHYLAENHPDYKGKFHGDIIFKFHRTIGCENFAAWLGASLCGATDLIQTRSFNRDSYMKDKRVPDFTCLGDNRLAGS